MLLIAGCQAVDRAPVSLNYSSWRRLGELQRLLQGRCYPQGHLGPRGLPGLQGVEWQYHPHHPPGPDFHPAYRLNPYMEHLYSSLQQHSSPAASIHGQYSMFMSRYVEPQWLMKIPGKPCKHVVITAGLDTKKLSHYWPGQTLRAPGG